MLWQIVKMIIFSVYCFRIKCLWKHKQKFPILRHAMLFMTLGMWHIAHESPPCLFSSFCPGKHIRVSIEDLKFNIGGTVTDHKKLCTRTSPHLKKQKIFYLKEKEKTSKLLWDLGQPQCKLYNIEYLMTLVIIFQLNADELMKKEGL